MVILGGGGNGGNGGSNMRGGTRGSTEGVWEGLWGGSATGMVSSEFRLGSVVLPKTPLPAVHHVAPSTNNPEVITSSTIQVRFRAISPFFSFYCQ